MSNEPGKKGASERIEPVISKNQISNAQVVMLNLECSSSDVKGEYVTSNATSEIRWQTG